MNYKLEYIYDIWIKDNMAHYADISMFNGLTLVYGFCFTVDINAKKTYMEKVVGLTQTPELKHTIDTHVNEMYKRYKSFHKTIKRVPTPEIPRVNKKESSTNICKTKKSSRSIPESVKKLVAGRQNYKCANSTSSHLPGLNGYRCPLWENGDGSFDESGYQIDHIIEFCKTFNNKPANLQALCTSCHSVKTRVFMGSSYLDM